MELLGALAGMGLSIILTINIVGGLIVGAFTVNKKISFGEAFALSFFFTPIIAIICVYLNK